MLSTTCWVIVGASCIPVGGKVYLKRKDAEVALGCAQDHAAAMNTRHNTNLEIQERTLVLAFGVTDQKVYPEAVAEKLGVLLADLEPLPGGIADDRYFGLWRHDPLAVEVCTLILGIDCVRRVYWIFRIGEDCLALHL